MDRERTSTSPLVFDDQEDVNNYVTKLHHFVLQQAMNDAHKALNEIIGNLITDMRQSKARMRDYLDTKLDAPMDRLQDMFDKPQVFILFIIFKMVFKLTLLRATIRHKHSPVSTSTS